MFCDFPYIVSEFIYVMRLDTEQFLVFPVWAFVVLTFSWVHTVAVREMGYRPVSWHRSIRRWRGNNRRRILAEIATYQPLTL